MNHLTIRLLFLAYCWFGLFPVGEACALQKDEGRAGSAWARLIGEADQMRLPTKFLKAIPPEFVLLEFDDLRTYAAEYHPGEHRMVLSRSLSFNAAAKTLKPLGTMAHRELAVLYHELFHAYMDYLKEVVGRPVEPDADSKDLMHFAQEQLVCRYGEVKIAPVVQRLGETELRYLSPSESWEALNEAWAVFVGWAVWNQLQVQKKARTSLFDDPKLVDQWAKRLKSAFGNSELRGYYAPEDEAERRVAQKRYLAEQLTAEEVLVITRQAIGLSNNFVDRVGRDLEFLEKPGCHDRKG